MSSIIDQLTELYVFVDDFLTAHPALAQWRQSPHDTPDFADAEVLTWRCCRAAWAWPASNKPIAWWPTITVRRFRICALIRNGWLACKPWLPRSALCSVAPPRFRQRV